MKNLLVFLLVLVVIQFMSSSCGDIKKLQYLQGNLDTSTLAAYKAPEPIIQVGDLLSIVVFSDNKDASSIYNQYMGISATSSLEKESLSQNASSGSGNTSSPGYLVDNEGSIVFHGLGKIKVVGLTKSQLIKLLDEKLKPVLTNAYFNVRFINFKVTVIGDVAKPSVYSVPTEKISILEAIGLAGDLNITARRDNVLIIRESEGKRTFGRLDLTKPDIFTSPYFQLQQNDVIYVDLTKDKAALNDQATLRNITIATSILTTAAIFLNLFIK